MPRMARIALVAAAMSVVLVVATPRPAAACPAAGPWDPESNYRSPPTLVLTGIVVSANYRSDRVYLARVEHVYRGHITSTFGITAEDRLCHLPIMRVGQRIAVVAERIYAAAGTWYVRNTSGPIWRLAPDGTVLQWRWRHAPSEPGPAVKGRTPRTLAEILRLVGIPDSAMRPPRADHATPIGMLVLLVSGAMLIAVQLRHIERDMP